MPTTIPEPFKSNADYLQAEVDLWLRPLSSRLGNEADARTFRRNNDDEAAEVADGRAAAAAVEEEEGRAALDARLAVHRQSGAFVLGLDQVCMDHDLNEDARLALLCMAVCAVSPNLAEEVFDRVSLHLTVTMCPETVARILDARTVEDHLRVMRLFQRGSRLLDLVQVDGHHDPDVPESMHSVTVRLKADTFNAILGTNS